MSLGADVVIPAFLLIGAFVLSYKLGQRSGYRKGKLDVYEEERRKEGV